MKDLPKYLESDYFQHRYVFRRVIGKGGFGLVLEVESLERNREVIALKIIRCGEKESFIIKYVNSEITIHGKIDHPNVVKFLGVPFDNIVQKNSKSSVFRNGAHGGWLSRKFYPEEEDEL